MSWLVAALKKRAQSVAAAEQPFLVGDTSFECVARLALDPTGTNWNSKSLRVSSVILLLDFTCLALISHLELRCIIHEVVRSVMRTNEVPWPSSTMRAEESLFVTNSGSSEAMESLCSGEQPLPSPQLLSTIVWQL